MEKMARHRRRQLALVSFPGSRKARPHPGTHRYPLPYGRIRGPLRSRGSDSSIKWPHSFMEAAQPAELTMMASSSCQGKASRLRNRQGTSHLPVSCMGVQGAATGLRGWQDHVTASQAQHLNTGVMNLGKNQGHDAAGEKADPVARAPVGRIRAIESPQGRDLGEFLLGCIESGKQPR